jgi:hypothetical protein
MYYGSGILYKGISETGDFLAGYGFEGDSQCPGWASGENDNLSAVDPTNKVVGTQFGAKGRFDAWVNSTPQTLVYNEDKGSSAFFTYYSKTKLGYESPTASRFLWGPSPVLGNERFFQ